MKKDDELESEFCSETEEIKLSIGVRVHELRHQRKLRLADVAEVTGMKESYLSQIERGTSLPSLLDVHKLSGTYDVSSEEILGVRDVVSFSKQLCELDSLKFPLEERTYTQQEYEEWPGRWEIIKGAPYPIPTPIMLHQRIISRLCIALGTHLGSLHGNKSYEVFTAPFEVDLCKYFETATVIQPDLTIIEGQHKLRHRGLKRAPELVVEVLSFESALRDRVIKYKLYKESGVQEYWIVDPIYKTVEVINLMDKSEVSAATADEEGFLESEYLLNFKLPIQLLFE
ncbi:Uma2 family endonuclease [Planococcus maritimus]|uniref:Uma2 family endonuclease n=1 Tax=Planococcus maritimus TaxID=192421 RepID=UPI00313908A8